MIRGDEKCCAKPVMTYHHDVQNFIDLAQRTERPEDLYGLMQDVTREIGFDHFALIHHGAPPAGAQLDGRLVSRAYIGLSDYPAALISGEGRNDAIPEHPILLASQRTVTGFGWDRIDRMITVTSGHRMRVEVERKAGIANGFTVPIHLPRGPGGSCSFAIRPGREVPKANLLAAQLVGAFAFEAACGLAARLDEVPAYRPRQLTPRLRDCIELAAQGKSDWEIARIIGLRETTVATYMQRARERYGVSTRMQVVLMALYDGEIGFNSIR